MLSEGVADLCRQNTGAAGLLSGIELELVAECGLARSPQPSSQVGRSFDLMFGVRQARLEECRGQGCFADCVVESSAPLPRGASGRGLLPGGVGLVGSPVAARTLQGWRAMAVAGGIELGGPPSLHEPLQSP